MEVRIGSVGFHVPRCEIKALQDERGLDITTDTFQCSDPEPFMQENDVLHIVYKIQESQDNLCSVLTSSSPSSPIASGC